ncbi:MAG TPA: glycosyltransferase 87 family protein [Candidatus Ozemobacteraceae bacterium]|nr:glycosyltransferase 87 family protein [Candidatus Ozemobacteraceae bacterium]
MSRLDFICLAALTLAVAIGSQVGLFQWDTEAYHAAGRAWRQGGDPYDVLLLTKTMGKPPLPFVYPPPLLPLAGLMSLLPLPVFHLVFLLAKLGALYLLFRCWNRVAGPGNGVSVAFALLAFHGALVLDLGSGNVAVFESLLLWLALEAWIDRRTGVFAAVTLMAAQIKLLPGAFLALGGWEPPERRRSVLAALAVAVLLLGAAYAGAPDRWSRFTALASSIDERGAQNPCMAALWRDLTGTGIGSVGSGAGVVPHALMSLAILVITWRKLGAQELERRDGRRRAVFLAVLAYALVAPRFKGYSYLLLVPAASAALKGWKKYDSLYYIFLCFGLVPFLPSSVKLPAGIGYLPAIWAFAFWVILLRTPPEDGPGTERQG